MDVLVDGSFCLVYCRLNLHFSSISFKVSFSILTLSAFSRQSTLGIEVSVASFMMSTKCFWYSSMSEAIGVNESKRFELEISTILFLECVDISSSKLISG